MKLSKRKLTTSAMSVAIGLLLGSIALPVIAAPSQLPLLSRDGWAGKPNVVFTIDDSGSMDWSMMPDSVFSRYPAYSQYYAGFDPAEIVQRPWGRSRYLSTLDGDMTSIAWRSNQINKVYYNPNILYKPWMYSDGTSFPESTPTAAQVRPANPSATTADLTFQGNRYARWCTSGNSCWNRTLFYSAAMYFQFNGGSETDPSNYTSIRIMDHPSFSRPESRTECNVDILDSTMRVCTRDQEMQNFANWFTYYRRRMDLSIGSTSQAFAQQGNGLRVGYGRINKGSSNIDGQYEKIMVRGVRTFDGTDRIDFFDWLHAQVPNGGTPLRAAVDGVGQYFTRSDNAGPWGATPGSNDSEAHLECRKSYHILLSDGYWNGASAATYAARQNVDNQTGPIITGPGSQSYQYTPIAPYRDSTSNTLADVAMYYWNRDLRPDLTNLVRPDVDNPAFWQQLVQFTVSLGVGGTLDPETDLDALVDGSLQWPSATSGSSRTIDDMWHAAVNTHGEYLSASDPDEFSTALASILQSISERESAEGGSAVSSITLETASRKFIPTYSAAGWSGDVQAKKLDINGVAVADLWNASEVLPAAANRNIYIGAGGSSSATEFKWSAMTTAQKSLMGPNGSSDLVDYLRGDRTYEAAKYRERDSESVLGDMVNSTPLLVGGLLNEQYQFLPSSVSGGGSYVSFLADKQARDDVLFIGANDGMLHAFRGDDGVEAFAFVPNSVVGNLFELAQPSYDHRFFVDGPLVEADAYIGSGWKNYVLGSLGGGGRAVFAIDTTDTSSLNASDIKWEYTDANLGYVMAPMAVGVGRNGKWQAYIGNGFESDSGRAQLLIVDLETGNLVTRIDTGVGGGNGLGGVRLIKDIDNVVTGAYAGDLKGNLWRFDMSDTSKGNWKVGFDGNPLYVATDTGGLLQAITAQPEYVDHPQGGQLVVFGSGRLFEEADLTFTNEQALYGVWDKVDGDNLTTDGDRVLSSASLVEQSLSGLETLNGSDYFGVTQNPVDYSTQRGWYIRLTLEAGQRVIYTPQVIRGFVLFSTVAPTGGTGLPCDDSLSTGYNVLVNVLTGGSSTTPLFDTNGDGTIDSSDAVKAGYKTVADGKDTLMLGKEGKVSVQRAFGQTSVLLNGRGLERTWRQLLNHPR